MNSINKIPQRVVVIGDVFVSPDTMEEAIRNSKIPCAEIKKLYWGKPDKQDFTAKQIILERNGPDSVPYADGLSESIENADIVMTHFNPIPRKLFEKAKNLKLILTCRGGLEHIDVEAASERNIPVINVIRNAEPVADFTLGLMLALTRDIALSYNRMREGEWLKNFYNSEFLMTLSSHTVGLAGLGNVGMALARKLSAMNVPIIAYDAFTSEERLKKAGMGNIKLASSLETLFKEADIVSLHLRLTPETEKIIDKRYFSLMKKTAYFINTARGGLVNQDDLIEALRSGTIAGAALDVYDSEPLKKDSPLISMEQVVLTSHIAGTTIDAIPKSPFMLMNEFDRFLTSQNTDRIVNINKIQLNIG